MMRTKTATREQPKRKIGVGLGTKTMLIEIFCMDVWKEQSVGAICVLAMADDRIRWNHPNGGWPMRKSGATIIDRRPSSAPLIH